MIVLIAALNGSCWSRGGLGGRTGRMVLYTVVPVRSKIAAIPMAKLRTRRADLFVGMVKSVPGHYSAKLKSRTKRA
jgi:hypothetical protein